MAVERRANDHAYCTLRVLVSGFRDAKRAWMLLLKTQKRARDACISWAAKRNFEKRLN